jgi:hypothetical protein
MERRIGREMFHHESLGPRKPKAHLEVSAQNPYVFIVGCQRSGTTLLRRIVNAHPEIAIPRETNWIAKWFEKQQGVTSDGYVTDELLPSLMRYEKFARMGIDEAEVSSLLRIESPLSYARFVSFVFDLYGMERGKSLVGDKTPSYVLRIPTLHALWPSARFVHLIRDGRDAALSALATYRDRFYVDIYFAARSWEHRVRAARAAGRRLGPDRYVELRYEDLTVAPEPTLRALCGFLGERYEPAMEEPHRLGRDLLRVNGRHAPVLEPPHPNSGGWRTRLAPADQRLFHAVAGGLLDDLGYEPADPGQMGPSERARLAGLAGKYRLLEGGRRVLQTFGVFQPH